MSWSTWKQQHVLPELKIAARRPEASCGPHPKYTPGQAGLSPKPPWYRLPIYALTGLMFPIIGLFELKRYQGFKETGNVSFAAGLHVRSDLLCCCTCLTAFLTAMIVEPAERGADQIPL